MGRTMLLSGAPRRIGEAYGGLVAPLLTDRLRRMWERAAAAGCGRAQLVERAETFRAFVERIAPEWLDEVEGVAWAAGVEALDLLVLNALPPRFWVARADECTSCLVVGSASATGDTLLHKNRDQLNEVQDFHVRAVPGDIQVLASREIGEIGFAHFHSDVALAGANNTGSPIAPDELRDCGLNCCQLLRLVAERANSCDEALAVLEEALAKEVAGGSGGHRGMIFLFAEPTKGVVVEMTSRRLACQEVHNDVLIRSNHFLIDEMLPFAAEAPNDNTCRRYERGRELLDATSDVNVADLARFSRDHAHGPDSICTSDAEHFWMTVSACTHVVRGENADPRAHTRAAMGNTRNAFYIPIPRAIDGLPAECTSGEFHGLAKALYAAHGVGDHLADAQDEHECAMAAEFASVAAAARFGPPQRLKAQLTGFVARCVARVRGVLEDLTA